MESLSAVHNVSYNRTCMLPSLCNVILSLYSEYPFFYHQWQSNCSDEKEIIFRISFTAAIGRVNKMQACSIADNLVEKVDQKASMNSGDY